MERETAEGAGLSEIGVIIPYGCRLPIFDCLARLARDVCQ